MTVIWKVTGVKTTSVKRLFDDIDVKEGLMIAILRERWVNDSNTEGERG